MARFLNSKSVLIITSIWFLLSVYLTSALAMAGIISRRPDNPVPVSQTLKIATEIALFPIRNLTSGFYAPVGMPELLWFLCVVLGMFLNALLWAILLVFLHRRIRRLFIKK